MIAERVVPSLLVAVVGLTIPALALMRPSPHVAKRDVAVSFDRSAITECFRNNALVEIVAQIRVRDDGTVERGWTTGANDPEIDICVSRAVARGQFPSGDREVVVHWNGALSVR